jgi:hypothetical protein
MHEFNQLEDRGHSSINGMIEKCASLALEFYGETDAEDQIDDDEIDDDPENQYNLDPEDPPDPWDATNNGPGEQGGDYGSEQGEIGPFAMV